MEMKLDSEMIKGLKAIKQAYGLKPGDPGFTFALDDIQEISGTVVIRLFNENLIAVTYTGKHRWIPNQDIRLTFKGQCVLATLKGKEHGRKI